MTAHIGNLEGFDLLVETIRTIDNSPTSKRGFDMTLPAYSDNYTDHPCGTACCIGGWAALVLGNKKMGPDVAVRKMTGIPDDDSYKICYPPRDHPGWKPTLEQAVSLLLHYRATGIVDWDQAMGVVG